MTHYSSANEAGDRLNGDDLLGMFAAAVRFLELNEEPINRLNVFPVPDGDTGTNMLLTIREMMAQAEECRGESIETVANAMARAALMSSRGNSGLILSQLFKGMAVEFAGKQLVGPTDLAAAFETSSDHAYSVIGKPVEGTILTVLRTAATAAAERSTDGCTLDTLLQATCAEARKVLALTPSMLPRLREAGVVDAGGYGLWVILEAMARWVRGTDSTPLELEPPAPVLDEAAAQTYAADGRVSTSFLDATEEDIYGYCTQFLLQGQGLDPDALRHRMSDLATSTVVLGDDAVVKVHVHTEDPDSVLSYARSLGKVSQVSVQDMDEQHREYSAARRDEPSPGAAGFGPSTVSLVAVAWGDGLESLFAEQGAIVLVAGDTMNPSVQEIVEKVEEAPGEEVIVLPNNPNILPAAQQAAGVTQKRVRVVPATTIPQGVAALLEFMPNRGLDENASAMEARLPSVRTGEVTQAIRAARVDGVSVRRGQTIGLVDQKLVAAGNDTEDVLMSLLESADLTEVELVTLYWGEPVNEGDALAAGSRVESDFPGIEVEVVHGGQPHYHYILALE